MTTKLSWTLGRCKTAPSTWNGDSLAVDRTWTSSEYTQRKARRWIRGLLRELSYRLLLPFHAPSLDRAQQLESERIHVHRQCLAEEYSKGYLAGWHECYDACMRAVEDEVSKNDELWETGELLSGSAGLLKAN